MSDTSRSSKTLNVAALLSDLTSLRVCENQAAAQDLVSARPTHSLAQANTKDMTGVSSATHGGASSLPSDPDLARAHNLINLHQTVEAAQESEEGSKLVELQSARERVRRAVASLGLDTRSNISESLRQSDTKVMEEEAEPPGDADEEDVDELEAWS